MLKKDGSNLHIKNSMFLYQISKGDIRVITLKKEIPFAKYKKLGLKEN